MGLTSARSYFEELARRGYEPRLRKAVGTWEVEIEGAEKWFVVIDHGTLSVMEGRCDSEPVVTFRCTEPHFLRNVRGDDHENLITAVMRGLVEIEGDQPFCKKLQALIP